MSFAGALQPHMDYDGRGAFRFGHCFLSEPMKEWRLDPACLAVSKSKPNYLLLGDSHAAHLWFGLNATFAGATFLQATAARNRREWTTSP